MAKFIFLGIIQGLTEFLPVSSSGHLVIMQKVLGITGQEVALSVILHLGTSLALIIFFFKDILNLRYQMRFLWLIIIVTIITGIIGILGKDFFESLFSSVKLVALALMVTGTVLLLTKFMEAKRKNLTLKDAVILGITQGIAIIPGISRTGITISTLLFRKIDRETSFHFSFLASIPAVLGAVLLEAKDINLAFQLEFKNFLVGFIFSLLTGLLALWILSIILRKAKLYYFGYYCILLALLVLWMIK